jgi:hypothetical protein
MKVTDELKELARELVALCVTRRKNDRYNSDFLDRFAV